MPGNAAENIRQPCLRIDNIEFAVSINVLAIGLHRLTRRPLPGNDVRLGFIGRDAHGGVVTLGENSQIVAIEQQAKSLTSRASASAAVGKFRLI